MLSTVKQTTMLPTFTIAAYGDFSAQSVRQSCLKGIFDSGALPREGFNRLSIDGKRRSRKILQETQEFRFLELSKVPVDVPGTLDGCSQAITITEFGCAITTSGETAKETCVSAFTPLLLGRTPMYAIGFSMPNSCLPALFALGMPYISYDWQANVYYERGKATMAWRDKMRNPSTIAAGAIRDFFELNYMNSSQVEQVLHGPLSALFDQKQISFSAIPESPLQLLELSLDEVVRIRSLCAKASDISS